MPKAYRESAHGASPENILARTDSIASSSISRRKFIAGGIGAAALAGVTAGCGSSSASQSSGKIGGTLEFSTWQWSEAGYSQYYAAAGAAFTKAHPGVSLEKISIPFTSYFDQIIVQMKANNTPDIYMSGFEYMPQYVAMGTLEPLDRYFDSAALAKFYPAQREYGIVDGHTYGVVMLNSGYNLWYNSQLFREAGIQPPTTIAEVIPAAQKLTKNHQVYGIAVMNTVTDELLGDVENWLFGWAPGANWVDASGRPALNTPAVRECLEFYKSILDSGACVQGTPKAAYREMMWEGRIAMMVDGPWYYAMAQAGNAKSTSFLSVAPTPTPTRYTPLADNILMIPKAASNKATAAAFIQSLYTPAWQAKYVEMTASPPGWADGTPQSYIKENPWFSTFADLATKTVDITPARFAPQGAQYANILTEMCSSYFFSGTSIDAATSQAQSSLTALL